MEKKTYYTPIIRIMAFCDNILQYQGSMESGTDGGGLSAKERKFLDDEEIDIEHQQDNLW